MEQHPGAGGESIVSDGLFAAEELRRDHPEDFKILASTDIYFWDKGQANYSWEMPEFFKIAKFPVIRWVTVCSASTTLGDRTIALPVVTSPFTSCPWWLQHPLPPFLRLNSNNEVVQIAVNNAIRDSHMDLPPHEVKNYYSAYKRLHNILYANAITFKMEAGEYCVPRSFESECELFLRQHALTNSCCSHRRHDDTG